MESPPEIERSYEISQEDGPSVIGLSVLSSASIMSAIPEHEKKDKKNRKININSNKIKHPLNLNNRHQRLILYNMIAFIWSLSYLIHYIEEINNIYINNQNENEDETTKRLNLITNELYLSYFLMIFVGSFLIIIIKCIELKEWFLNIDIDIDIKSDLKTNIKFKKFAEFIHNFVGLIYFTSFILHIAITWKVSNEVCNNGDNTYCKLTFISSHFYLFIYH